MAAPTVRHWHTCEECLLSWEHDPPPAGAHALANFDELNSEYHRCPECHAGPWGEADITAEQLAERRKLLASQSPAERKEARRQSDLNELIAQLMGMRGA
jgi:hypothetical protein